MIISATEYRRPHGRFTVVTTIPDELAAQWNLIGQMGLEMTVESLPGQQASVCLEDPGVGAFVYEIMENTTSCVRAAVQKMIREFRQEDLIEWREYMVAEGE